MFIGEVAIIRLFFLFFLILEFNYIFPSAFHTGAVIKWH